MIRNGLYKITYATSSEPTDEPGEVLAVVRRGRIFGSDRFGAVYRGYDATTAKDQGVIVNVTADVPPGGELMTGFSGGENGAQAQIVGRVDPAAKQQRAIFDVAGSPLEIDITFLGPLPN